MPNSPVLTLVAPSRALVVQGTMDAVDSVRLARIEKALANLGWSVREAQNIHFVDKRFAGSDNVRARALEKALTDKNSDLALSLRGGYGASRLLPLLDWNLLPYSARKRRLACAVRQCF